jgi:hypothetical protein
MKLFTYTILIALICGVNFSCKKTKEKVDELTEFDINYTTNLSVPSQTLAVNVPVDFTTPDISTQSASKFSENNTTKDLVSEIKLTKFNISVASGNLDFLKSLSIYIKSGSAEVLVGTKTNIPTGISETQLDLQDVNIKSYISEPTMKFRVTVTIDASTTAGQSLKMDQTVRVKATLIK